MMLSWEHRPIEVANLLNPPFCAEILRRCFFAYEKQVGDYFPYPLTFLVLPIVLHKKTREMISSKTRDHLDAWLHKHQEVRIGFAERAKQLIPITNEALTFLLNSDSVEVNDYAKLIMKDYSPNKINEDNEVSDCFKKSEIVGKWFAKSGNPITIYTMWGVRP